MDILASAKKVVIAMSRGTIVVDENVKQLTLPLRSKNIRVLEPRPGEKDEDIVERLLPNRIIVTKNPDHFVRHASSYDIGIIDVSKLKFIDSDPNPATNKTVQLISDTLSDLSLWSKRNGFLLTLYSDKEPLLKDLID